MTDIGSHLCRIANSDFESTDNHHFPPTLHSICDSHSKVIEENITTLYSLFCPYESFGPEEEHKHQYPFGCGTSDCKFPQCILEINIRKPFNLLFNVEFSMNIIFEEISEKKQLILDTYSAYSDFSQFYIANLADSTKTNRDLNLDTMFCQLTADIIQKTVISIKRLVWIMLRLEKKANKLVKKISGYNTDIKEKQIYLRDSDTIVDVIRLLSRHSKTTLRAVSRIVKKTYKLSNLLDLKTEDSNKFVILE